MAALSASAFSTLKRAIFISWLCSRASRRHSFKVNCCCACNSVKLKIINKITLILLITIITFQDEADLDSLRRILCNPPPDQPPANHQQGSGVIHPFHPCGY
ncbi:MAG: hypothetical protein BWY93_01919 [Euryarchaeota archaeon ADurb.BinA087]|nr:MAG: hypothetical protein BWY93_01919 [Euryarchaeota archaeon ADurb.BinA087]